MRAKLSTAVLISWALSIATSISEAAITPDQSTPVPESSCLIEFHKQDPLHPGQTIPYGFCSATLIGPHSVLTAAHCYNLSWDKKTIRTWIRCPNGESHPVQSRLIHPDHSSTGQPDLALFETKENFQNVKPMPVVSSLEEQNSLLVDPKKCFLAGWGKDASGQYGKPTAAAVDQLSLDYFTVTNEGGISKPKNRAQLSGKTLAQPGDSGGSLYCWSPKKNAYILVGVPVQGFQKSTSEADLLASYTTWIKLGSQWTDPSTNELIKNLGRLDEKCRYYDSLCLAPLPQELREILIEWPTLLKEMEKSKLKSEQNSFESLSELKQFNDQVSSLNQRMLTLILACQKAQK